MHEHKQNMNEGERMSKRVFFLAVSIPLALLLGSGCIGSWNDVDADRPNRVLTELRERELDYDDSCSGWTSRDDAGGEPDRYVEDVYLLTDNMLEACNDLVNAGRVDRDDYDRVDGMRVRLRGAVDGHRTRLDDIDDIDAMHEECDEHHLDMLDLFDETELRLRDGRMMGSGGMMG